MTHATIAKASGIGIREGRDIVELLNGLAERLASKTLLGDGSIELLYCTIDAVEIIIDFSRAVHVQHRE